MQQIAERMHETPREMQILSNPFAHSNEFPSFGRKIILILLSALLLSVEIEAIPRIFSFSVARFSSQIIALFIAIFKQCN
jgi:hypothetical protein